MQLLMQHRPRHWLILLGVMLGSPLLANSPFPPNQEKTLGTTLPEVHLTDDGGKAFLLSDLKGKPLLISPVFSTCKFTCGPITENLKNALPTDWKLGTDYNILTFSFDPADKSDALKSIRDRHQLPGPWKLAIGNKDEVRRLLDAIDFRYMTLEKDGFSHSNFVVAVDPDQHIRYYLLGVNHTSSTVSRALEAATGIGQWKESARVIFLFLSLAGLIVSTLYFARRFRRLVLN